MTAMGTFHDELNNFDEAIDWDALMLETSTYQIDNQDLLL